MKAISLALEEIERENNQFGNTNYGVLALLHKC